MDYIYMLKQWAVKYPRTSDFIKSLDEFNAEDGYVVTGKNGRGISCDAESALEMVCDEGELKRWLDGCSAPPLSMSSYMSNY